MGKQWQNIRVELRVYVALWDMIARLEKARSSGHPGLEDLPAQEISFSQMIERLIRHVDNDQRRKRESRKRIAAERAKTGTR